MIFGVILTNDIQKDIQKENIRFYKLQKRCFHSAKIESENILSKMLKNISNHVGNIHEAVGRALTYTHIQDCVYMIAVRSSKKIL